MATSKSLKKFTNGKIQFEFFCNEIIDLQRELARPEHKETREKLMKISDVRDFSDCIKHLATEVDIVLDGMYTPEDTINLASKITDRLIKRRGGLLVITGG